MKAFFILIISYGFDNYLKAIFTDHIHTYAPHKPLDHVSFPSISFLYGNVCVTLCTTVHFDPDAFNQLVCLLSKLPADKRIIPSSARNSRGTYTKQNAAYCPLQCIFLSIIALRNIKSKADPMISFSDQRSYYNTYTLKSQSLYIAMCQCCNIPIYALIGL